MKPLLESATLPVLLVVAVLSLLILPKAGAFESNPSPAPSLAPASLTFGSQIILEGCWSAEELQGAPGEKKSSSPRPSSTTEPLSSLKHTLPALDPILHNSIRSVTPADGRKVIALTFDLCEGQGELAGYDADIVAFLRAGRIKATFFAGGKWLQSHPHRSMQLMADPLFEIGNHSWDHPNFRLISKTAMQEQIARTQALYQILWEKLAHMARDRGLDSGDLEKIPRVPLTFRFPFGTCNEQALQVTAAFGLPAIQWSIVTADSWKTQTPEKIARTVVKRAKPGAIVIMHANGKGRYTAQALVLFVPPLQQQGYEFVTVSELLQTGPVFSTPSCYEEKPNDNVRYDRPRRNKTE